MDLRENVGVPNAIGVRSQVTAQTFQHPDQYPVMIILGGIIITYIMQQYHAQRSFTVSCYHDMTPGAFLGYIKMPLQRIVSRGTSCFWRPTQRQAE